MISEVVVAEALLLDDATLSPAENARFTRLLRYSITTRHRVKRVEPPALEILNAIEDARAAGDLNEATWRAFLAAHFGRLSASINDGSAASAARLLCADGAALVWTWSRVSRDHGKELSAWLKIVDSRRMLTFGNHRQYEQSDGRTLMEAIRSFINLAAKVNGPANLLVIPGTRSPTERFDYLYKRFDKLAQFGRLGSWDFIDLLLLVRLVDDVEPESCYLIGSTGPIAGARKIWPSYRDNELDRLAAGLATRLGVSCFALEDALCNFNKVGWKCCGDADDDGQCRNIGDRLEP